MTTEDRDYSLEWIDEIALFRITRPAKRNAITRSVLDGLAACCDALDRGQGRALIVTGEGDRAFCSGTDLGESASMGAEESRAKGDRARDLLVRIHRSPWTSIAALNGLAYGGGFELALACTFRVAAPGVALCLPEVKLAVLPSYGGTQFLPAVIGRARALDLMLTGRPIVAEEAQSMGLVDRLSDSAEGLMVEAEGLAKSILVHSQFTIDRMRRCVDAAGAQVEDRGLAIEANAVIETMDSEDAKEGVTAFLQKRKPEFKNR